MLNVPGFIYTVIGVLVTIRVWPSLGIFLEPSGMPVLTSAFVFVTWLMLLAKNGFPSLIPVAPADATTPEDNLRRYLASQKNSVQEIVSDNVVRPVTGHYCKGV